jgi:para-nitrobenzyl esterase
MPDPLLRVWTPAQQGHDLQVLVWFHGGAFLSGSPDDHWYDGQRLAERGNLVVVAGGYRLGAAAFLAGNGALRDQIAVLDWVQDHIAQYGGDPTNVTAAGQSAGAMSVGCLMAAGAHTGRFHRAILQSGPPDATDCATAAARREELLGFIAAGQDLDELSRMVAARFGPADPLPWQPVIDEDLLTSHPLRLLSEGAGKGVTVMAGTTQDEFIRSSLADPATRGMDEAELVRRVSALDEAPEALIDAHQGLGAPVRIWAAILAEVKYHRPTDQLAAYQHAQGESVFLYRWMRPSPALGGLLGAVHFIEVPFVFDNFDHPEAVTLAGEGPEVEAVCASVQDRWISFVTTGDPRWPAWDPVARHIEPLGLEPSR